jgi:hypothetical protein
MRAATGDWNSAPQAWEISSVLVELGTWKPNKKLFLDSLSQRTSLGPILGSTLLGLKEFSGPVRTALHTHYFNSSNKNNINNKYINFI